MKEKTHFEKAHDSIVKSMKDLSKKTHLEKLKESYKKINKYDGRNDFLVGQFQTCEAILKDIDELDKKPIKVNDEYQYFQDVSKIKERIKKGIK